MGGGGWLVGLRLYTYTSRQAKLFNFLPPAAVLYSAVIMCDHCDVQL